MDDTQIEMLPMLGEFSSIASQYEHIMFYYESGIQQIVAKLHTTPAIPNTGITPMCFPILRKGV